jgi:hypothetical protein
VPAVANPGALLDSIFGPDPAAATPRPHPAAKLVGAIDLMASGLEVVSIPDAKGELIPYRATGIYPEHSAWALQLERADGRGKPYRVSFERDGRWVCDCKDATHRAKKRGSPCKHVLFSRALWSVLAPLVLYARDGRWKEIAP